MANSNFRHLFANTVDGQYSVRNYVRNAFARENTNGWATYANTAQATPVTGTGGSPVTTLTRNTSSPLRWEADFLITKDAANRQGEGVSYDFTIDPADKNKLFSISFDYSSSANFVSGTNSDLQVFLYDVTGAVLIPLQTSALLSTPGFFTGSFQASNDTQYRLIFHIATTNALAWTVEYTNVQVNTISLSGSGPIISDWSSGLSFSPSAGYGTVVGLTSFSRRIGDSLEVNVTFVTGTVASSTASIGLPTGYKIDSTKLSALTTAQVIGAGYTARASSTAIYASNTAVIVFWDGSDTSNVYVTGTTNSNSLIKENVNNRVDSSNDVSVNFTIPIQGWGSNTAVANSGILSMASIIAAGTRVTGTDPAALGEWRSQLRNANAGTYTDTNGSPGISPTATDGIAIYQGNAFTAADTNNKPTLYKIFIGKNKSFRAQYFGTTGRTGISETAPHYFGNESGTSADYDPTTGVLQVYVPRANVGTTVAYPDLATSDHIFFDIIVADNDFQIQLAGSRFFASSAVTTQSSGVTSSSFTTFSNSPAFTFTPSVSGTYKVYCGLPAESDSGNASFFRVFATSGSPTLLQESQGGSYAQSVGTFQSTMFIQSVYLLNANTTYVFAFQGKTGAGTIFAGLGNTFYMFAELIG